MVTLKLSELVGKEQHFSKKNYAWLSVHSCSDYKYKILFKVPMKRNFGLLFYCLT